jgi:hypothetical protein
MIHSIPVPVTAGPMAGGPQGELPPAVVGFLERLRRLPLGAWVEAGRRLEELDRDERAVHGRARPSLGSVRARLREVVDRSPHVVARARHRVLDQAAVAQGFVHPAELSRMKKAALAAVLALVARPTLGEERFARVYEPFAGIIPLDSLPGAGGEDGSNGDGRGPHDGGPHDGGPRDGTH